MTPEKVSIKEIRPNKNNPRVIRDEKFKKLVKSLIEYPEMMKLRPIVVNQEGEILGGNMRYKASKEAGLEEVWIIRTNFDEKKSKEFLIKDNVNYGNWDYLLLEDFNSLEDWGMDTPDWIKNKDFNNGEDQNEEEWWEEMEREVEEESSRNSFDPGETSKGESQISTELQTTYFLIMLDADDYDLIKRFEQKLLTETGTDNLSDAVYKIIMEE
jgi:hypothetical protein